MAKKRIVVIGGGFAGISALKKLSKYNAYADVILINKSEDIHFRPLIPDIIDKKVNAQYLLYPILLLKNRYGFTFFYDKAIDIDFKNNTVITEDNKIPYDSLLVTAGSQTAFPPGALKHYSLRIDSVHDANLIRDSALKGKYKRFVICGGGYTGAELATTLQSLIKKSNMASEVIVVEMLDRLVNTLPLWIQDHITRNLKEMGIQIRLSTSVADVTESEVILSNGDHIKDALCIWTTGLIGPDLTRNLEIEKKQKGRIHVDKTLRFKENCFAAGDVACFETCGICGRMSVQFSIEQGSLAAQNAIAVLKGKSLSSYVPFDPGYIIPMANGNSCGEAFGFRIKGALATFLHYLLSAYRSYGIVNRFQTFRGMLRVSRQMSVSE